MIEDDIFYEKKIDLWDRSASKRLKLHGFVQIYQKFIIFVDFKIKLWNRL